MSLNNNLPGDNVYDASLKAITILLVVAVLLESALAVIFNWRVFRAYFSVAGLKTLISFVVSLFIVQGFGLDIMSRLLSVYEQGDFQSNLGTQLLTALIIAGGSSGVNKLLVAFGYRDNSVPRTPRRPRQGQGLDFSARTQEAGAQPRASARDGGAASASGHYSHCRNLSGQPAKPDIAADA